MWKFIKNLLKKEPKPTDVSFDYGEETTISAHKDKDGLWTVDIRTHKELTKWELQEIIEEIKRRTK